MAMQAYLRLLRTQLPGAILSLQHTMDIVHTAMPGLTEKSHHLTSRSRMALARQLSSDSATPRRISADQFSGTDRKGLLWLALFPIGLGTCQADASDPTPGQLESNHPLDYDPVTNEHTARMTLARRAALDAYNRGRYQEAERRFKEAVEAAKEGFAPNDPHVASCLNNLAEFYRNTRQYAKAEPAYKQALQLLYDEYGDNHWLYVSALHNMALMYAAKQQLGDAQRTLESVLELREKMFGNKHITYADSEVALASILLKTGKESDLQRAVKLMEHAVWVLEESGNVEGTPILQWLADLSQVLTQQRRFGEAAQSLRKTLQYMSSMHGELQAQASGVAEQLVAALLESGDVAAARDMMQQSTEARMQLYGRDLTVARSLSNLAGLWLRSDEEGDIVMAEHFATSAVSICQDLLQQENRKGVFQFLQKPTPQRALSKLQVAAELSSALSLLSRACLRLRQVTTAVSHLRDACGCLRQALQDVQPIMEQTHTGDPAVLVKLATKYVEAKLQLLEVLEALTQQLKRMDTCNMEELQMLKQEADGLAQELLTSS